MFSSFGLRRRRVVLISLVLFVVLSVSLYSIVNSPSVPDSPPQSGPAAREGLGPQADDGTLPSPAKPYGAEVIWPVATGEVAALKDIKAEPVESAMEREERDEDTRLPKARLGPQTIEPDKVVQTVVSGPAMPSPIANFDGGSKAEQNANFSPPDTNGDIGYDPATGKRYYFQWINIAYKAWDVSNPASPTIVVPLTQGNALWQAALPGSTCALTNDGDPIALFDEQAHRWLISQFSVSGLFHQCVAVSKTADPAGGWYVYDYAYRDGVTYFNDYPHFGIWPDPIYNAYFMTMHQFNASGTAWRGQAAAAFDRARLLSGSAAPMVLFDLYPINQNFGGMLAADLDGTSPPAGTPGFFFEVDDSSPIPPSDALRIWEFKPNWTTPASSTFGLNGQANYTLPVAAFNLLDCGGLHPSYCIPQSGTSNKLDALADRLMHRVAFRVLNGITQTAALNHTVDAGSTRAGVRWYQVQRNSTTGNWTILQQSTYAPADGVQRWMGSIATDRAGDIALGYSASSSSIVPAIRYAGRLVTDTIGSLPQTEVTMTVSSGVQTGSNRWGDYAMMGVDPQDGCTFWFTEEYNGATGLDWKTRIGSFKFPGCTPIPTGNLTGTVVSASNSNPISGAVVVATDLNGTVNSAYTNVSGYYQLLGIPTGSYTVAASAGGYQASTATGVAVSTGLTATQDFSLVSLPHADIVLTKTASAATIAPGGALTYTLVLGNNGPDNITGNVVLTDNLPGGFTLGNAAGTGWNCVGTATVVCTRAMLNVNQTSTLVMTGAAPAAVGPAVNAADVSSEAFDTNLVNNTSSVTVTVVPQTDLAITKAGPSSVSINTALVYTLSVTNNGPLVIGPFTQTFTDSNQIMINDNTAATPYPATLAVAGLPPIQKATARISGFTHTYPRDVDMILVGPSNAKSWLMSDPGGAAAVTNVNLNFDDAAGSSVSCVSGPTSGTYQPTNCAEPFDDDTFPAPAPTGPYAASLAQFNNTDPNGTWGLYVRDDVGRDTGAINGGWSLTLSGSYSLTVTDTLPPGATYGDASGAGWTCTQANGIVTCTRSALALGAAPDIIITAIAPLTPGVITNTATVASGLGDPDASGNTATWVTNVVSETTYGVALAPLAASQSGDPGTVVTYTLTVTNMGNVDDTFTVTLGSNSFSTNAPTDVGPLGAGSSTTFNVVVAIPAGAVEGMTDTVNVTVTSQGNPLMTAGAALTTLVNRRLYLPLITKQ